MITYRRMAESDLSMLSEVDRSECIRVGYEIRGGLLMRVDVVWDSPNFNPDGEGEHTVSAEIDFCRSHLGRGAIAIGGFDGEKLAAIGIITPEIRPAMAQLAYLHVSRPYRRKGIATAITRQLLAHAIALGARQVYVSAVPSESAVGFYKSFGFNLTIEPLAELYDLEPDDIHMTLALNAPDGFRSA